MSEEAYIKHYGWMTCIKGGAMRDVYAVLYSLGGSESDGVSLSVAKIAEIAGYNVRQVARAVAELQRAGLVQVSEVAGKWNEYHVCTPTKICTPTIFCTPTKIGTTHIIINNNIINKREKNNNTRTRKAESVRFTKPTAAEVQAYCDSRQNGINGTAFCDFYESKGWVVGKSPMKDWQAAVRTWERKNKQQQGHGTDRQNNNRLAEAVRAAELGIAVADASR